MCYILIYYSINNTDVKLNEYYQIYGHKLVKNIYRLEMLYEQINWNTKDLNSGLHYNNCFTDNYIYMYVCIKCHLAIT